MPKSVRTKSPDWPLVAARLAARFPHETLHSGALETAWQFVVAEKKNRAPHPTRWAVAFSGGADSLALLLLLWAHGEGRWGRDLVALHFNHRLRGRAADADEKFCAQVCAALGVKFVAGRWRIGRVLPPTRLAGGGKARPVVSEAEARAARMEFFARELTRRKIRLLWLGHQQDDIAETMLMRLARGSGTAGLAAPRPAQPMPGGRLHLRPLLALKKPEIIAALRAAGAVWREDATNAGDDFFRNRVRRAVVPAWRRAAAGRDALAGAALSRALLEEDDAALEAWTDAVLSRGGDGFPLAFDGDKTRKGRSKSAPTHGRDARATSAATLDLAALAGLPRAVVRRVLHRWLLAVPDTGDLSRQGFEQLLALVECGAATRFSLGRSGFAVIRRGRLAYE
jgi:tRNA(Ile)-lysidine synthase